MPHSSALMGIAWPNSHELPETYPEVTLSVPSELCWFAKRVHLALDNHSGCVLFPQQFHNLRKTLVSHLRP